MLLIGEGTAEIQKMIIGRRLLEDFALKKCALRAERYAARLGHAAYLRWWSGADQRTPSGL